MRIPHNWLPEPHQLPVLNNSARFKVIVWHRKAHKTTLAINELVRWAASVKGTYWYVAPFYSQAKKIVWQDPEMLAKYVPPEIWEKRNNSDLTVTFPNGSVLYVLGADNPDALRGPNPKGVVLDEYGDMKTEVWSAIVQPVMIANPDSWCWFTGTPKGQNDFKHKFDYAVSGDNPLWAGFFLDAETSGIISKEGLEEARKSTTQAYFDQEFMCKFLAGAGQYFRRIRENVYDKAVYNEKLAGREPVYKMGVDLAKYNDWTVITLLDLNLLHVLPQDRFNQVDWNLQKARILSTYYKHEKPDADIDSTGVGDPIVEDLSRECSNINGFKFTEQSRRQLLDHLCLLLEQDKVKLPMDEGLIAELESFRYVLGERGKAKIEVPDGLHDDRVMSLALACWGVNEREPFQIQDQDESILDRLDRHSIF